ncbi:hypothetical protein [Alkaliphilus serpentinus]|uniref:hypothetical protein n=1 Tax=Alkaliphilus serpentinus TaxID=1482731 RepID=UPI0018658584|nr:hypothetical protein [Alkaliphilus serpentinus]
MGQGQGQGDRYIVPVLKAPKVHAGYTYVSVYKGYFNSRGGGGSNLSPFPLID